MEDVQNYFETRKLSQRDRVEFIYEHIDGKVRSELRYRPEQDKRDSDSILAIIQQVFGESESLSVLQETFFRRVQKEGEALLEYSLALMQLFDKIQKCSGGGSLRNVDKTLKDKFTEGIRDEHLRRELRRLLIDDERLPFWMFRDRAIKYLGKEAEVSDSKESKSSKSKASVVNEQVTEVTAASNSQLVELLKNQQEQLNQLATALEGMKSTRSNFPRRKREERVCYLCDQPGHIVKNCPKNPLKQGGQKDTKNVSQSDLNSQTKPLN